MPTDSLDVFSFHCATCGQVHEGLPALGFDWPLPYLLVPEEERAERAELTSDTCVIDEQDFFARVRLEIPVHGYEEPMSWGVWVSLSETNFARFVDLLDEPGREREGPWFGWLSSALPGYPDTLLLKTSVHPQPVPFRPIIELEPTDHPLAVDQREGVSPERVRALLQIALHLEAGAKSTGAPQSSTP